MKNLKISRSLIFLFLMAVVLLAYFNFVYLPLDDKTNALDSQHAEDQAQITEYDNYLAQLRENRKMLSTLQEKLTEAQKNSSVNAASAAADISRACLENGVTLNTISMGDETIDPSIIRSSTGKLLCSISVALNFHALPETLSNLLEYFETKSNGSYYITGLNYNAREDSDELSVSLSMTLYYYSETAVLPPTASSQQAAS